MIVICFSSPYCQYSTLDSREPREIVSLCQEMPSLCVICGVDDHNTKKNILQLKLAVWPSAPLAQQASSSQKLTPGLRKSGQLYAYDNLYGTRCVCVCVFSYHIPTIISLKSVNHRKIVNIDYCPVLIC